MKDWSGRNLCFECARKVGANINIGRQFKGRCHRCHSEQTLFLATEVPVIPAHGQDVCPECAHPIGTHAASCRRSELELLRKEREEIVRLLEEFGFDASGDALTDRLRRALEQGRERTT